MTEQHTSPAAGGDTDAPGPGDEPGRGNAHGGRDEPGRGNAPGRTDAHGGGGAHGGGASAPGAGGGTGAGGGPGRGRLVRSRRHRVVSGTCGGLGRHFDVDPVVFRIVLAVLALVGGAGLLVYGLLWLLVPVEGEEHNEVHRLLSGRVEGSGLTAVLVSLVGCGLFLAMLGGNSDQLFALAVVAVVLGAAFRTRQRPGEGATDTASAPPVSSPPAAQPPPVPAGPSWWREPLTKDGPPAAGPQPYRWGPAPAQSSRGGEREESPFALAVFSLAVIAATAGTSLAWDSHPAGTSLQIGLACALAVLGAGLAVSAWAGRTGVGTVFTAVVVSLLLAGVSALPASVGGDWGHRVWRPTAAAEVRDGYALGGGTAELDLTGVAAKGRTVGTRADVGTGTLRVRVPDDVTVRITAQTGMGAVRLPGDPPGRTDLHPAERRTAVLEPVDGERPRGVLVLDLNVGLGQVEVVREAA
ncbi:PspC domain-containing protein [Streptomyces sp. NPDC059637]|uniref:PspC domain-containing protein n=1 Tax=Streptomyces sp. NPDC059637 TaxID=3347752 RepID=UPI0036C6CCA1